MNKWEAFLSSWASRGAQNFMLLILTVFFSFLVAFHKLPPEMTLTPVLTGMMAFFRSGGGDAK